MTAESVYARECAGLRNGSAAMQQCRQEVDAEAVTLADQLRRSSDVTIRALRDVLDALKVLDGPKTLILMSEGFAVRDSGLTTELGALAAATRTSIYALKLDNQLFDITNSRAPVNEPSNNLRNDGLEMLAAAARGTLFLVNGTGSQLFTHIESELSGYYLLGVESDPADRDRKARAIRIDVARRGATVRTRRQLLNVPADVNRPRTVRDAITASLTAPLLASALPLRVATFALRGPEQGKVQLLIRAEVGSDYTGPKPGVIGYVIMDRDGKSIETRTDQRGADAGDERRARRASVFGRREPRSRRVHHQARGRRRRSDRQRRTSDPRVAVRYRRGLAQRLDGGRTDRRQRAAASDGGLHGQLRLAARLSRGVRRASRSGRGDLRSRGESRRPGVADRRRGASRGGRRSCAVHADAVGGEAAARRVRAAREADVERRAAQDLERGDSRLRRRPC